MPTGLTYSTYQTQIAEMAVVPVNDTNFQAILPAMIDYAELRIYQDLDLISTVGTGTATMTANNRRFRFEPLSFITTQQFNVVTPYTTTNPGLGTRVALVPTTMDFLNWVYNSSTGAGVPQFYAMQDQASIIVGPWPDQAYTVEIIGTIRPQTLGGTLPPVTSASVSGTTATVVFVNAHLLTAFSQVTFSGFNIPAWNSTPFPVTVIDPFTITFPISSTTPSQPYGSGICSATLMSQQLDQLLIMASMVYISAYQRNFGRQSDDPAMSVSYESQYQALKTPAMIEEARKKYQASGWTSQSPPVAATPGR